MTRKGGHRARNRRRPRRLVSQRLTWIQRRQARTPAVLPRWYPISFRSDLNRSRKMALCAYIARYFEWNGACQNWRVSLVSPHDSQLEGKENRMKGSVVKRFAVTATLTASLLTATGL